MSDNLDARGAKAAAPKLSIEQIPASPEEPREGSSADTRKSAHHHRFEMGEEAVGFIRGLGLSMWAYARSHHYTVLYGFIGFVLAVLILTIGLWATIVIAVFVGIGAMLGQIRDGDNGIVNFFSRLFGGNR